MDVLILDKTNDSMRSFIWAKATEKAAKVKFGGAVLVKPDHIK
jgi:hypothetical protein